MFMNDSVLKRYKSSLKFIRSSFIKKDSISRLMYNTDALMVILYSNIMTVVYNGSFIIQQRGDDLQKVHLTDAIQIHNNIIGVTYNSVLNSFDIQELESPDFIFNLRLLYPEDIILCITYLKEVHNINNATYVMDVKPLIDMLYGENSGTTK